LPGTGDIGGGVQVQKTLTAIQAWRQGYVTDSTGKITAKVPQDLPTLIQGALFGKSAFASVKKSSSEITALDATINQQQATGKLKDTQARNIWTQLEGMPKDQAQAQLEQIAQTDPDMATRVIAAAKDAAAGITKTDTLVKSLGVQNGARANYIVTQLKGMSSNAQKQAYLLDLANKGLLSSTVMSQVASQLQASK
jgi:ribosomal protein L22